MNNKEYDIIIIGAGAVGCSMARELSRYDIRTLVLEKECDVAFGTSGRNSAVVHAGFNNKTGTLMARFCVEGNEGFEALCQELDIPYNKTGKILVAFDDEDMETLKGIIERGEANGCKGLKLVDGEEIRKIAPNIGGVGGMLSPNTAIFDPFKYCIAMAENAKANGTDFLFEQEVTGITKDGDKFVVETNKDKFESRMVVNAAGLFSDKIAAMVGLDSYKLYPCRGEYFILDKKFSHLLDVPAYPVPKKGIGGLGVHFTPTIEGNLIIGPSAEYIEENDDYACTPKTMDKLLREAEQLLPQFNRSMVIGNYSGIRPKQAPPSEGGFRDFSIKEEGYEGFYNLVGIESPGFTASMPIAKYVIEMIKEKHELNLKSDFNPVRKAAKPFREMTDEEKEEAIAKNPEYGEIICRCQSVTRKEIRDAIENPLGAKSISSIKYRAWATTGRCNGGYCLAKIVDMLVKDYGMSKDEISYRSSGTEMFTGKVN